MMKKEFVFVCTGKDCKKRGAKKLCQQVKKHKGLRLIKTKCMDACKKAPNMIHNGAMQFTVSEETVRKIADQRASGA